MDLIKIQDAIRLEYDRKLENLILTEVGAVLKSVLPRVKINKSKLKQWILQEKLIHETIEKESYILPPKFKFKQKVYLAFGDNVISGTVDGYDLYKEKYLVFIDDTNDYGELGFGNEWFLESELFASKNEALASIVEKEGE